MILIQKLELFKIENEITFEDEIMEYENNERGLKLHLPDKFLKYYSLTYQISKEDLEETKKEFLQSQNESDSSN